MNHTSKTLQDLAMTLLQGLCIHDPTQEQCKAAEGFIRKVVLPVEKNCMAKVGLTPREWLCLTLAANGFSAGETACVNYRFKAPYMVVDKVLTEASLVSGVGQSRKAVLLTNTAV